MFSKHSEIENIRLTKQSRKRREKKEVRFKKPNVQSGNQN